MTPARLQANRRNAQKSTGPRTARGKSQSRLNGLRNGFRSRLRDDFLLALLDARPGTIIKTARAVLTPAQARHPLFAQMVYIACKSQREVARRYQKLFALQDSLKKDCFLDERSQEVYENKGSHLQNAYKNSPFLVPK